MTNRFQILDSEKYDKFLNKKTFYALLIIAAALFLLVINRQLNISGDNARYIILSESIANSGTYTNSMGVEPVPETHYPFFYPLVLSPLTKVFGINFVAYRALNAVFGILCGLVLFSFYGKESKGAGMIVAALTVLNPLFLSYINIEMTEVIYTFLSCLTLLAASRYDAAKGGGAGNIGRFLILMFLLVASFYTRTIGIALLLAVVTYDFIHKRYKSCAIVMISFIILILPWSIRSMNLGMGYVHEFTSRSTDLAFVIDRTINNFNILFLDLTDLLYYPFFTIIKKG